MGFKRFAVPSCGSAGTAAAIWASRNGRELRVFLPDFGSSIETLPGLVVDRGGNAWSDTYSRFWEFCDGDPSVYPLFPSGDPNYLSDLVRQASSMLQLGFDRLVVPCGSGVHLLALAEAIDRQRVEVGIIGVQLLGMSPIVSEARRAKGLAPIIVPEEELTGRRLHEIPSMSSQRPVNLPRLARHLARSSVSVEAVSWDDFIAAVRRYGPEFSSAGLVPDPSVFVCLAACEDQPRDASVAVICTGGRWGS